MSNFKPASSDAFRACMDLATVQLAHELSRPADRLETERIHARACRLYDRAGGAWVPNDTGWRYDNE